MASLNPRSKPNEGLGQATPVGDSSRIPGDCLIEVRRLKRTQGPGTGTQCRERKTRQVSQGDGHLWDAQHEVRTDRPTLVCSYF